MKEESFREKYYEIHQKYEKQKKCLLAVKAIVDAFDKQTITVKIGIDALDCVNKVYDLRSIMGVISNNTYEGLGLDIPAIWKE